MGDFRDGIAQLSVGGTHVGSAWLVTPDIVCTANHCVDDCELEAEVVIKFRSVGITGTIIVKDVNFDIALIQINPALHSVAPLKMIARPRSLLMVSPQWLLHGYPVKYSEYHEGGLSLNGSIDNANSGTTEKPLIQLSCIQGMTTGAGQPAESPFGGVSGCPVLVRPRDNEDEMFVIGVLVHHHAAQDRILYCTPIDEIVSRYVAQLQAARLKSWDAAQRVLVICRSDNGFRTNLDESLIKDIWQDGLTGLWCDLLPDESIKLTSAIERLVVQSPFAKAASNTQLHFKGASAWQSLCERCASDWVPVQGATRKSTLGQYSFLELEDVKLPFGGDHFDELADLANHVRVVCNQWVLERLRARMSETFNNPGGELNYNIAPDVVSAMKELWSEWVSAFQSNPETLHHFIGLMLSVDGGVSMASSAAGAGPETIDKCVLHATVFAMALCVALPKKIQNPRGKAPGNLGQDDMSGHSSGVQTMSGINLNIAGGSHKWKTLFVMLPHLNIPWEAYRVTEARFDKEVQDTSGSFNQEPDSSLILPADTELMKAMSNSLDTLRELVNSRYSVFQVAQVQYVASAASV